MGTGLGVMNPRLWDQFFPLTCCMTLINNFLFQSLSFPLLQKKREGERVEYKALKWFLVIEFPAPLHKKLSLESQNIRQI